jgi:hypothetical protein
MASCLRPAAFRWRSLSYCCKLAVATVASWQLTPAADTPGGWQLYVPVPELWRCENHLRARYGSVSRLKVMVKAVEIWKFLSDHAATLGVVVSLISILGLVWKFGRRFALWLQRTFWLPIIEGRSRQPKRTFLVQPGVRRATFWVDGNAGNEPIMHVRISLHLTNVAKVPVQASLILLHYRRSWGIFPQKQEGDIVVRLDATERFGKFPVPPGNMVEGRAQWLLPHPFQKPKEPIRVRVRLIDQFGNQCSSDWMTVYFANDPRHMY